MKNLYFVLFFLVVFSNHVNGQWAVVIKPVADCFGEPVQPGELLPMSYVQHNSLCKRYAQILLHETVRIISAANHLYEVEYPGFFFLQGERACDKFYIEKNALLPLPIDSSSKITLCKLPPLQNFKERSTPTSEVVTLMYPLLDQKSNITFSAGTRFLRSHNDTPQYYGIYSFEPTTQKMVEKKIPRKMVFIDSPFLSNKEKQQLYVSLIRKWINGPGIIPYVWGGMSFTHKTTQKQFNVIEDSIPYATWGESLNKTATGCDCSGLVVLATRIVGIPYPYRNTATLSKLLRPIRENESIENGDLLWFNGHVIIISDIHKNLIIESAGYKSGFGKVHEIPLHKRFKNVKNFKQLKKLLLEQKPIGLLNSQGHETRALNSYQIYKFSSLYDGKSIQKD